MIRHHKYILKEMWKRKMLVETSKTSSIVRFYLKMAQVVKRRGGF